MAIARVYFDQDMRCSIDGLKAALKLKGVAVPRSEGDLVLFMNRSKTMFKMLSSSNHLVLFKAPKGKVTIENIKSVSKIFSNTNFKSNTGETQTKKFLGRGVVVFTDGAELKVAG